MKIIEQRELYDLSAAEGDLVYTSDTKRFYIYTIPNGWEVFSADRLNEMQEDIKDTAAQLSTLSLYDLNKQIIAQLPNLTDQEIEEKKTILREFKKVREAQFYMLLNNEIRYYTLFEINDAFLNTYPFEQEVVNCLLSLGSIKAIDLNSDGVIEAWVDNVDAGIIVLYLFPYDEGVITCL